MNFDEARLIETYRPRILYFLLRKLRDRELAEDMTQEVLLAAIQALRENRLQEEEKLPAFIFGIARNLLYRAGREAVREDRVLSRTDSSDPVAWSLDPEAEILLKEQRAAVRRALDQLSAADADILRRSLVEASSMEEIAAELGVDYAAVRKRKSRAVERLRALFTKMSQSRRS